MRPLLTTITVLLVACSSPKESEPEDGGTTAVDMGTPPRDMALDTLEAIDLAVPTDAGTRRDATDLDMDAGDAGMAVLDMGQGDSGAAEACVERTWFVDVDRDGHGNPAITQSSCAQPMGYVESSDDCDDGCAACHPGTAEMCGNGLDEDCTGGADNGCACAPREMRACPGGVDTGECSAGTQTCSGGGAWDSCAGAIGPVAETCNGRDDDCDGMTDDDVGGLFFRDVDGDGFGDAAISIRACSMPSGYVTSSADCNDGCMACRPGGMEICGNGLDEDCAGGDLACDAGMDAAIDAGPDASSTDAGTDAPDDAGADVADVGSDVGPSTPDCGFVGLTRGWNVGPSIHATRRNGAMVVLQDGRVLFAGGINPPAYSGASEVFDPGSFLWSSTSDMRSPSEALGLAMLLDGRVLAAGGEGVFGPGGSTWVHSEIFDPSSGMWTTTTGLPRYHHAFAPLVVLNDGRGFIAGGWAPGEPATHATEFFDPSTGTWSDGPRLPPENLAAHVATLLSDGMVLVAGGYNGTTLWVPNSVGASAEAFLFDPAGAGRWIGVPSMSTPRWASAAVRLGDGRVLVLGGQNHITGYLNSAEIFDPSVRRWTATAGTLTYPRAWPRALLLPDGRVLVVGGNTAAAVAQTELFDPATGMFTDAGSLMYPRQLSSAASLRCGAVVVAGGEPFGTESELYVP